MNSPHCRLVRRFSRLGLGSLLAAVSFTAFGQVNVLTQHNDISRSGANTQETILTTANVNSSHTVRLHFCETFWTAAGDRVFNVSINGTQVLTNFDIFATAGGQNIANIQQFTENANASGQYVLVFTTDTDKALISGIEID